MSGIKDLFRKGGGKTVTISNRDAWEAADALGVLVSQGWADPRTALRLGKTHRALRTVREDLEIVRTMLVKEHSVNGGVVGPGGGVQLKDPVAFAASWRKTMAETATVEIFPVAFEAVMKNVGQEACEKCRRPAIPALAAVYLEALAHVGIVEESVESA